MKIEKVSENQIRCTLTKEDLASRELKISELAYGTEKAKNLFRDMMRQANFEFGFEAEDIPLMIEAIPVSPGSPVHSSLYTPPVFLKCCLLYFKIFIFCKYFLQCAASHCVIADFLLIPVRMLQWVYDLPA